MDEIWCSAIPRGSTPTSGPVIDDDALAMLEKHAAQIVKGARWSHRAPAGREPAAASSRRWPWRSIRSASLQREVFGPVVHVVRYRARDLDAVVGAINALGYGLTLGIHTRIDGLAQRIARALRVGNVYINRNMIGAVVGVQPFGGMGLSGTGPEGRRPALPAPHGDRADHHHEYGGHRRQCRPAVARSAAERRAMSRERRLEVAVCPSDRTRTGLSSLFRRALRSLGVARFVAATVTR